jgi:hypothetical protein
MANIPLWGTDFIRRVAKTASISLKNRWYEKNPVLSGEPGAVIARPGLKKFAEVGTGPVRKVFSSPGVFDGDLFVVSGSNLYRVSSLDLTIDDLGVISTDALASVSMCTVAPFGEGTPGYLYIAEGGILWMYTDNGHAMAHLQAAGAIANNDVIRLDTTYYTWTNASVDASAPAGTSGNPWRVALGANNTEAMTNMYDAVNGTGIAGTTYSTVLVANPTVRGTSFNSTDMYFEAIDPGTGGNSYSSTETGANLSFGGTTFSGGGTDQLRQVLVPDDAGAISVASINSYVIVVPVQEEDIKGRFYWIKPGENTIDALDFATAERNPDGVHQVVVFGDMFWLLGEDTTEPWITTGDPDIPMSRFTGILFDRGSWEGTAVQVKDSLIVVDENGGVFQIGGGQKRISRPDIEERVRRAIQLAALFS